MSLQRVDEQYRGLVYPWGRLQHPGDEPFEVAPGLVGAIFYARAAQSHQLVAT